jgi:hypothetical protein
MMIYQIRELKTQIDAVLPSEGPLASTGAGQQQQNCTMSVGCQLAANGVNGLSSLVNYKNV